MASITVRKLDDGLKRELRIRAAANGRSMESEVRAILRESLSRQPRSGADLLNAIRGRFAAIGGVELELPARDPIREPPDFSDSL